MLGEETEIDYDHSCDLTSVNDPFQSFELSSTLHCRSYPNPFNPSTTIEFELVSPQYLNASVYNIAGDKVQNLFDDFIAAGIHKFHFDGAGLGSGLYIVAIETGRGRQFEKLLLVK